MEIIFVYITWKLELCRFRILKAVFKHSIIILYGNLMDLGITHRQVSRCRDKAYEDKRKKDGGDYEGFISYPRYVFPFNYQPDLIHYVECCSSLTVGMTLVKIILFEIAA